ncbi:cytochrome P450 [Amycolatopsis sp. WGS_07]|uniref:cytochrome P450 n=1 Tax=Amycolatopsis sp. WGS_07 TaxID=3076764 RepID=UPI003872AE60
MSADRLPAFPMRRPDPFAPPPEYAGLRERAPVSRVELWSGASAWVLTRYQDVRAMLGDARFSSDPATPGFPVLVDYSGLTINLNPSLVGMEGAAHSRARRAVLGEFSTGRVRRLRPKIQEFADTCLDALAEGPRPADLVRGFALPVPSLVICEVLGVPYRDHEFFQSHSAKWTGRLTPGPDRQAVFDALRSYLDDLVAAKEREPGNDLLGRQVLRQRAEGEADHDGLVSLAFVLLLGGFETTANMIALGTAALLEHPAELEKLRRDPRLLPGAIEELLRLFTVAELATIRATTADVEIGGVRIPAGEGVIGLCQAANHDPDAFDCPAKLDIERTKPSHLAFGYGTHQCIGQGLARAELEIALGTLLRRMPSLKLAKPLAELPLKHDSTLFGVYELPVTW